MNSKYWYHTKVLFIVFGVSLLLLNACSNAGSGGSASGASVQDESGMEKVLPETADVAQAKKAIVALGLVTPQASQTELQSILSKYNYVDPTGEVPVNLLARALDFYDQNKTKIANTDYLSVVDFSKANSEKRLFVIRMQDGFVFSFYVAHGSGSDPNHSGVPTDFSDKPGSNMSSLGYYLTDSVPETSNGVSLRLDGVSSTNSNARLRALALYGADYVQDAAVPQGDSWGGFAIPSVSRDEIIHFLQGRSLLYAGQSSVLPALSRTLPTSPTPAPPSTTPSPTPTTGSYTVEYAPLWEAARANDGRQWTLFSFDVVQTYGSALLAGTNDITNFCPNYANLSNNQKINFWVYLVSGVVKYESGFNPLSRYQETTMGTDPITGQPVYSEGLMQLSYQDIQSYSYCEFDWSVDKNLSATDPNKTILDPYKNLKCGIRILNSIVSKHQLIAFSSGQYWATLKPTSSAEQSIQALTRKIPFCQ